MLLKGQLYTKTLNCTLHLTKANKMGRWVKVLATRPDNLCSIPRTHMVERELTPKSCLLSHTHIHKIKEKVHF